MHYNTIYCQIYFGIYWISHSGWNIMLTAGEKYAVNNAICVYHAAGFLEKKKKKCVKQGVCNHPATLGIHLGLFGYFWHFKNYLSH